MISKISMSNVASYKAPVTLETDKKINLLYGLNGAGKTVLSTYIYDRRNPSYSSCYIDGLQSERVLVYNERFIQDNFYEAENLRGIFTLSKENKTAEESIQKTRIVIKSFEEKALKAKSEKSANEVRRQKVQTDAENKVWEIKTTYSGGDRVLEFCLENMKGRKETLFNHIIAVKKPDDKPLATIDSLKRDVELLQSQGDEEIVEFKYVTFPANDIEKDDIWNTVLVGNENSYVAGLIQRLNNADWVKKGITFLEQTLNDETTLCPFCQQKTITLVLRNEIKGYFDENYEATLKTIELLRTQYTKLTEILPGITGFQINVFAQEQITEIELALRNIISKVEQNLLMINKKIQQPSQVVALDSTVDGVEKLNNLIGKINEKVKFQNERVKKRAETLTKIRTTFWQIMRFDYDQTIAKYFADILTLEQEIRTLDVSIDDANGKIRKLQDEMTLQQKTTINIDEAVQNINEGLNELGIDSFSIVKHQESFYKISRNGKVDRTFKTLSEGEKMIISFLYFRELCRGRSDTKDTSTRKIVVIDDPISSLSHIYVFNIGRLIKNTFLKSDDYEQVFVFTHSLYFFYEIIDTNHDTRNTTHKLFRLSKNNTGSFFKEMKYEEIQSDYQAYWYIIRDLEQPAALIANSMRNILEYFINFIEKRELNALFNKPEFSSIRYQAFIRFINRESHSVGQNIFDYKEFDYDEFRDAFKALFFVSGYEEHYNKMMKK